MVYVGDNTFLVKANQLTLHPESYPNHAFLSFETTSRLHEFRSRVASFILTGNGGESLDELARRQAVISEFGFFPPSFLSYGLDGIGMSHDHGGLAQNDAGDWVLYHFGSGTVSGYTFETLSNQGDKHSFGSWTGTPADYRPIVFMGEGL
jgi:hypothetical protein